MNRFIKLALCLLVGSAALLAGLWLPAHLHAMDTDVLRAAGRGTPTLSSRAVEFAQNGQLGPAQMLLDAERNLGLGPEDKLQVELTALSRRHPNWIAWGGGDFDASALLGGAAGVVTTKPEPVTELLIRRDNRERVLEWLNSSPLPEVRELLRTRGLTNTTLIPPSGSASGQAFDAAVSLWGILLRQKSAAACAPRLTAAAMQANHGGDPREYEQALLDILSLGQRMNGSQLSAFIENISGLGALGRLAELARDSGSSFPVLYSAVVLTKDPAEVTAYLAKFSETGLRDLGASAHYGAGSIAALTGSRLRLYESSRAGLAADWCLRNPTLALMLKALLYVVAGFWLAAGLHLAWPVASGLERNRMGGLNLARGILAGMGLLLIMPLLSEPYLATADQAQQFTFHVHLPGIANAAAAVREQTKTYFMNPMNMIPLLLFFVLQALIYTACLVKLAEILRHRAPARTKLKLLENEEHLFDAGLYLGFVGTIISLILASMGIIQPSLMAAYSSTSFGIIFVSAFKIFQLRPARRKLLLEAESLSPEPAQSAGKPAVAALT